MSSDSSFNIHNALYFVKYPSRAAKNSPEGRRRPAGRGLKTPDLEGMVNGEKVCGRRSYQIIDDIKMNELYEDTKKEG